MGLTGEVVVSCFLRYLEHERHAVSRAEFEMNLFEKFSDRRFLDDMAPLFHRNKLGLSGIDTVCVAVVCSMPGDEWVKTGERL